MAYYLTPLSCAYLGVSGATHSSWRSPSAREQIHHPRRKPGSGEGSAKKKAAAPRRPRAHGPLRPRAHGPPRLAVLKTPCARACTVPTGPPCARDQLTPCTRASQDGRLRLHLRLPFFSFDPKAIYSVPRTMFTVSKVLEEIFVSFAPSPSLLEDQDPDRKSVV